MAKLKIEDLQVSADLDQQAQAKIWGGQRAPSGPLALQPSNWSLIEKNLESGFKYLKGKQLPGTK